MSERGLSRVFADERGVWAQDPGKAPWGIEWPDIYEVAGAKLDAVTEVYTYLILDFEYGESIELHQDSEGFEDVVKVLTERLPGIAPDWFSKVQALTKDDPPLDVWKRG